MFYFQSESVANTAFSQNWFEGNHLLAKDIKFFIARCQMPAKLNTFPLGVMNYQLYVMVSFLILPLQMYDETDCWSSR